MFQMFDFFKKFILALNDNELYTVFELVIKEMNNRKTKELLEVQQKMRAEKAKEEYKKGQNVIPFRKKI